MPCTSLKAGVLVICSMQQELTKQCLCQAMPFAVVAFSV